jgi:hypothetical protein
MLLPHYIPPENARYRWETTLAPVLPASRRKYPSDAQSFTEESFLRQPWADAYRQGWEEFFWEGSPFAVHLRSVGRSMLPAPPARDKALLGDFLAQFVNRGN